MTKHQNSTDDTERKADTVVRGVFGPGYRRFLSPTEIAELKARETRGELGADVIKLKPRPPNPRRST